MNVHSMQVVWLDHQPELKIEVRCPTVTLVDDSHEVRLTCQATKYQIILSTAQLRTLRDACDARLAEVDAVAEGVAP